MDNQIQKQPSAALPSLPERKAHREWIGGAMLTLLSHYWRDDDPVELTAAIGKDWADVLEGLPQDAITKARLHYLRTENRKPKPSDIYRQALSFIPKPKIVPKPEPENIPCSPEVADEIVKKSGLKIKRFGQHD